MEFLDACIINKFGKFHKKNQQNKNKHKKKIAVE